MLSELPIVEFNIHFICLLSDQRRHKSNGRIWSLQQRNNELCIRSIYPLNCHFHWQNCVVASEWHVEKETSPRRNITSLYKMGDQKNSWMDKSKTSILFHVCDCVMCSVCVCALIASQTQLKRTKFFPICLFDCTVSFLNTLCLLPFLFVLHALICSLTVCMFIFISDASQSIVCAIFAAIQLNISRADVWPNPLLIIIVISATFCFSYTFFILYNICLCSFQLIN